MVSIALTKGMTCRVDAADYAAMMSLGPWYVTKCGTKWYARSRRHGYMHRVLLPDARLVDHIDRDGLNNQRSNLRPATRAQNSLNGSWRHGSSQFRGVSYDKARNQWVARFHVNGKPVLRERFDSELAAARACAAARERVTWP